MSSRYWRTIAGITAAALCAMAVSAAQAGNIRGSWDPQFNGNFLGTGFLGEVVFFVPDTCLANGTPNSFAYFADGDACSAGGMNLVSAEASLYNWPNTTSIISTITFAPPTVLPDPILGIRIEYSATGEPTVVGLDTAAIGPQPSGAAPSQAPDPLYLLFASGDALSPYSVPFPFPLSAGAYLLPQICTTVEEESICGADFSPDARSNPGQVAFTPEPGSLALLLSAIGAGWFVRRRKTGS